jgi:kinesin family protein 18/19
VLDGYNATVFAYGATGCGKTHTITGTIQQPGIIFLTMQELFERIGERTDEKVTEVSLSYLEIYNETIRDLLLPGGSKAGLMLREDSNQTCSVAGLTSHHPQNVQEVMDMIVRGNEYRTMSPTEANATSSRSHAVLQINVSQKDRNADINEPHTMATLSIIDLAGSERASATKNRGDRLIEGANINKSLLALGSCINALCDPRKKNHVPYRNSKLTRLLKFSLGGNCRTVMIVCVSPSSAHFDETQNTLRYANRAKNIQTKVTRNVFNVNRHVKDFLVKIDEQMAMINELKLQQKEYETVAFTKFRKQAEKREGVMKEGISRIRNAYDCSSAERMEKLTNMKKLREIERRIATITSWAAAFDYVCEVGEQEAFLQNVASIRKTAQGMLLEFENSRHHYHQRLSKCNWERAIDSALQNGLRQLQEMDGGCDVVDTANLTREAELLKANAEREALSAVAEQERGMDAVMVQILLQAQFETIAAVQALLHMDEGQAVLAAKKILANIVRSSTTAVSNVIKPDGSIAPVELFPPTRSGTPKRKKQLNLLAGSSPLKVPNAALLTAPHLSGSPLRLTPKRRKMGGAKKVISFTPKKKSPSKGLKRGVRWRDDTEEGALVEFQKTPQRQKSSPDTSSTDQLPVLPVPDSAFIPLPLASSDSAGSSPIPPPPEATSDKNMKHSRFKAGFLSKKSNSSLPPPTMTNFSSDSDHSPLRDLEPGKAHNRSLLQYVQMASDDTTPSDSGNNSSSDVEDRWKSNRDEAMKIKTAMKRASLTTPSTTTAMRALRRRSPTGTSSGSPPNENATFTASHARRMVKSERETAVFKASVLSPRTAPVMKATSGRRTTLGAESKLRESSIALREGSARLSSVVTGSGGGMRGSFMPGKGTWK